MVLAFLSQPDDQPPRGICRGPASKKRQRPPVWCADKDGDRDDRADNELNRQRAGVPSPGRIAKHREDCLGSTECCNHAGRAKGLPKGLELDAEVARACQCFAFCALRFPTIRGSQRPTSRRYRS